MRKTLRWSAMALFTFAIFIHTSCLPHARLLGYGMLLWPQPTVQDGQIVAVLAKSNITKTWIVAATSPIDTQQQSRGNYSRTLASANRSRDGGENAPARFEVPLWALAGPMKEAEAKKLATQYMPWQGQGAKASSDGLPIRAAPSNSAKRVYRLKLGQVINVLGKWQSQELNGPMEIPTNGGVPLEGEWLLVVTGDGSQGWCFSHNLLQCPLNEGE